MNITPSLKDATEEQLQTGEVLPTVAVENDVTYILELRKKSDASFVAKLYRSYCDKMAFRMNKKQRTKNPVAQEAILECCCLLVQYSMILFRLEFGK